MSDIKILTLGALSASLVALLPRVKGLKIETDLTAFSEDFKAYCDSPVDGDQLQIKQLSDQLAENETLVEKYKINEQEAIRIINTLKDKLKASKSEKAAVSAKPTVEIDGVLHRINHGAHPHSIDDLIKYPDLVKEILKIEGQLAVTPV